MRVHWQKLKTSFMITNTEQHLKEGIAIMLFLHGKYVEFYFYSKFPGLPMYFKNQPIIFN